MVSTMATVFNLGEDDEGMHTLREKLRSADGSRRPGGAPTRR